MDDYTHKKLKIKRYRLNRHESYVGTNFEILKGDFSGLLTNRYSSEIRIFICSTLKGKKGSFKAKI